MKQKWLEDLVFYEIYPNSYMDSNNDGYGDFKGIISKLDYIASLHVDGFWLNPHYDSPFMDGGYDIRDYFKPSPRFGTEDEFKELIKQMHDRNLKLIIDLVAGHTSDQNPIFLLSAKPERNEYSDMFVWTNDPWNAPYEYRFMQGKADRNGAYMVNFFATQPALNYGFKDIKYDFQMSYKDKRVVKTRKYLISVIMYYLEMGVDGFRVDMADSLVKGDDNKEATIWLWNQIFKEVRAKFPQAIFVSEWNNLDRSMASGFDMDFALNHWNSFYNGLCRYEETKKGKSFLRANGTYDYTKDLKELEERINRNKNKGYISFISCNHDTPRPTRFLKGRELFLFYTTILTLPGVPFIYYGDEIGMDYQENLNSVECGFGRTGTRTPMQWDNSKNQGFSQAEKTFLPVDYKTSLEDVSKDENSIYYHIKKLIDLRHQEASLKGNNFKVIYQNDKRLLMYQRNDLLVIINPDKKIKNIDVKNVKEVIFIDGDYKLNDTTLSLKGQSGIILRCHGK